MLCTAKEYFPKQHFSLSIFANMQAIVNNTVVELSERLAMSEFFAGWRELMETRVTWEEPDVKLDAEIETISGMLELDTEFHDEFLLLNMPLEGLHDALSALNIRQVIKLIEAADYFGESTTHDTAMGRLTEIIETATTGQLVQYYDIIVTSYLSGVMKDVFCTVAMTHISRMNFDELTIIYPVIKSVNDRDLYVTWINEVINMSSVPAVAAIESEIDRFVESHSAERFANVDWSGLYYDPFNISFSEEFLNKYEHHRLAFGNFQDTDEATNELNSNHYSRLTLQNLPFATKQFEILTTVFPNENWIEPRHINNQWNGTTIDYENYGSRSRYMWILGHRGPTDYARDMYRMVRDGELSPDEARVTIRYMDPESEYFDPYYQLRTVEHQNMRDANRLEYKREYGEPIYAMTIEIDRLLDVGPNGPGQGARDEYLQALRGAVAVSLWYERRGDGFLVEPDTEPELVPEVIHDPVIAAAAAAAAAAEPETETDIITYHL